MFPGIYVGHHERSGSVIVLTENGVSLGRGFNRLPFAERWKLEGRDKVKGVPWLLKPRTQATEQGVDDRVIDLINRWRKMDANKKGSMPMRDYYLDMLLIKKIILSYSAAL